MADKQYDIGDLKFSINDDGDYDISLLELSPECDPTLQNALLMSIFTKSDWWGNEIDPNNAIGSDIHTVRTVNSKGRSEIEMYIKKSIAWLVNDGYVKNLNTTVSIDESNLYKIQIDIESLDGTTSSEYFNYLV